MPLARSGHALALSTAGFGSGLPLCRRDVRSVSGAVWSPCRQRRLFSWAERNVKASALANVPSIEVAVHAGPRKAVSCWGAAKAALKVPLAGQAPRRLGRGGEGRRPSVAGGEVTPQLAKTLPRVATILHVAVPLLVAKVAVVAARFVGKATAPTHRSSGPAQKAAQAPQLKR